MKHLYLDSNCHSIQKGDWIVKVNYDVFGKNTLNLPVIKVKSIQPFRQVKDSGEVRINGLYVTKPSAVLVVPEDLADMMIDCWKDCETLRPASDSEHGCISEKSGAPKVKWNEDNYQAAVFRNRWKHGRPLVAYRCNRCRSIHLGNPNKPKAKPNNQMSSIKEELADYSHDVLIKMIEDIRDSAITNFPAFASRIDDRIFERSRKLVKLAHGVVVDTPEGPGCYWIHDAGSDKHKVTFKNGSSGLFHINHIRIL